VLNRPSTDPAYVTCVCGCQRFHDTTEIIVRGQDAVFLHALRCDDCGRLARAEADRG